MIERFEEFDTVSMGHLLRARRTEADYQAWRDQRDWTTRKYAMRETSPLPVLILRPESRLISAGVIRHADVDFMPLTDGQRRCGYCGLEGGFLGGIPILDIAVVQHAPLVSLRYDLILCQSHQCLLS